MVKVANRDIEGLLGAKCTFKGNSVTAKKDVEGYKVYSYNTLIYNVNNLGGVYFNNDYFSATTSKLQNILCRLQNFKQKRGEIIDL